MYRTAFRRFVRHRLAIAGMVYLALISVVAIFAPVLSPYDPVQIHPDAFRAPPSAQHLLGTDVIGRDVLSRLIHASRVSLSIGVFASIIAVSIGTVLGAISGYYRGWVDAIIMRITDTVLAFPSIVLILVVVVLLGPSVQSVIIVLGGLGWPTSCRIVRASFLSLREQEFALAARVDGVSEMSIIFRHLLPNALGPVLVAGSLGAAAAILVEASLSFIGLGVQAPTASWGNMLLDAQTLTILQSMPWLWMPPGTLILTTVLAINFVGDGLRDALDPRSIV